MQYQLFSPINHQYSPIEQVLTNRGINIDDIFHYLNLNEDDNLPAENIKNINEALALILKHLNNDKKIFVQVDSDCDGYTSAAVLLNYLHRCFPSIIENKVIYNFHEEKVHGINVKALPNDVSLVIVPDASSNEYEVHKQLFDKSIDVLVIDHHHAEKESEYACIINNQLCNYPTKSLSGVGMIYKVCQFMDRMFNYNYADDYLDLVSLGLIADLMDQRDFETSYLTQKGLKQIRNPFIYEMVENNRFSIGTTITPMGIAFYVAPFVNAITRVGTLEEKQLLFESMLEWKSYDIIPSTKRGCKNQTETRVMQSIRTCLNVKNRQEKIAEQNIELIEDFIQKEKLLDFKILIIKLEQFSINRGLTGLIANKLANKYHRPTLVLNKCEEDDEIIWSGSARGYNNSPIKDFRNFVSQFENILFAEGHNNAFGFAIKNKYINDFINWTEEKLKNIELNSDYLVDYIFSSNEVKPDVIKTIGQMKSLWGQNLPEPYVAVEQLVIHKDNVFLMSRDKKPTLKISLPNGISCIKFKSSEEEFNTLVENENTIINLLGTCNLNDFRGQINPQIIIQDYEIIGYKKYYF